MKPEQIYLDHNASTPIDPLVAEAMLPFLRDAFGNPSSDHWAARSALEAVEAARGQVADFMGANLDEIVFTSGGSEANNMALKGVAFALRERGNHIITTAVEHPAIHEPCEFLKKLDFCVTYVPVDSTGKVDPERIASELTDRTILVSVGHANGEVGTVQPLAEISQYLKPAGILFHSDAAQSAGKISIDVDAIGVDMLSLAGHKMYAPKGVGALYIRRQIQIEPLIHGGGHERGHRSGTESALLTVALGKASQLVADLSPMNRVRELRDWFWRELKQEFGDRVELNGHPTDRLPNTLNVSFVDQIGPDLLSSLEGIAVSTGSACHTGSAELSPVLRAMNVAPKTGLGAIRFSLGRGTVKREIDTVLAELRARLNDS
ncbi:MAG: cysteine desulfurase family protein [Hyphomicrobiaceae bacterium]